MTELLGEMNAVRLCGWAFARLRWLGLSTRPSCRRFKSCAAMARLADELVGIHAFMASQRQLLTADAWDAMVASQAKLWTLRFSSAELTADEGQKLTELLATGPWRQEQKSVLGNALVQAVNRQQSQRRLRRALQTCKTFSNYLTKTDVSVLASEHHDNTKLGIMVDRCLLLGLHLPNEPTSAHILSTAIEYGLEAKTPKRIHFLLTAFKKALKGKVKHAPRCEPHVEMFPDDPKGLPDTIYSHCYREEGPGAGDDSQSSTVSVALAPYVPMRKQNRTLRDATMEGLSAAGGAGGATGVAAQVLSGFMAMMQQYAGGSDVSGELPGFQVFAKGGRNRGMPEEARQALQAAANGVAQTVRGAGGSQTVPEQMGRQTVQQTVQGDLGGQSASVPMGLPTVEQTEAPQKAIEDGNTDDSKPAALFDLPLPSGGSNNDLSPTTQCKHMAEAMKTRKRSAEEMEQTATPPPMAEAKAKAKAKAKATAKATAKAKATPKAPAQGLPQPIGKGQGTFFYKDGKIHRGDRDSCWRVFLHRGDRCDRKVPWKGDLQASWRRALQMISAGTFDI